MTSPLPLRVSTRSCSAPEHQQRPTAAVPTMTRPMSLLLHNGMARYAVRSTRRHTVPSGSTQLLHTIGIFGVLAIGHSISLVSVWLDLFQFRAHDASCFTNWHYARLLRKKLRRTRPLQTPMLWRCLLQTRLLQRRYAIIVS